MTKTEWRVPLQAQRFVDYPMADGVCPGGSGGVAAPVVLPLNAMNSMKYKQYPLCIIPYVVPSEHTDAYMKGT